MASIKLPIWMSKFVCSNDFCERNILGKYFDCFSTELAARSTNTSRWSCAMAEKDGRVGNRLSTIMNSGVLVERCCSRWLSSLPLDMAILLHALRGAKSLLFSTQSLGCHCFCCICRILVGFGQFDRCSWNCVLLLCSFAGDIMAKSFKWIYAKACLCRICPGVAKRRAVRARRKIRALTRPRTSQDGVCVKLR